MIRGLSSLAAAAFLSVIVLAPVALRAEDASQMSVPAAAAPADEGVGCPGKADGKPCCAGCETRQRISKGKATGLCPCQQRAKEAKEAAAAAQRAE